MNRLSFERQILTYFLLVVLMVGGVIVVSVRIASQARADKAWVTHTQNVLAQTDTLVAQQKDLVMAIRGFMLTGKRAFLEDYGQKEAALTKGLDSLRHLTRDNPSQQQRIDSVQALLHRQHTLQQSAIALAAPGDARPADKMRLVERGDAVQKDLQALLGLIKQEEAGLMTGRSAAYQQTVQKEARVVRILLLVFIVSLLLVFVVVYRNTRKRNRAEADLRRNKQLIKSIIEHAPVLISVKDVQGRYLLVNKQMAYALHTTTGELMGNTVEAFVPAEVAEVIRREDAEVVRSGQPSELEIKLPGPEGLHSYITSKVPLHDEKGRLYAVGSIWADITPIKHAHEALARQYQQQQRILNGLQAVLSASSDMICITNEEGEFVMISDTAQQLLGYSPKELMSKRFLDFVAEEDRERTRLVACQIIAGNAVTEFTNHYRRKDGTLVPVIWSAKWLAEDRLMYCIARNGTERQRAAKQLAQSRARLAHAQTIARMGNWEWDLEHNSWSCSVEVYNLLGLKKDQTENIQLALLQAIHPEDRVRVYQTRQKALRQGATIDVEHRIVRPGGAVRYMQTKGEATLGKDGKPVWFSGTMQDITERKQAELALQQLNHDLEKRAEELRASNAELERFAYVASHDLQEPLRMVSSFVALLQKKLQNQLDDTARQYIHFAVDGAERMKRLIQDLLQYSRLGTQNEAEAPVDLNEVKDHVLQTFEAVLEETNGTVSSDPLPEVMGSASQITQLIQNLVGNALKYRSEAPPQVGITCTDKGDNWEFCVRDNGIGIDPKFFDKIFIIFQRLHNKSEYSGTGIGLAISKKIVERHGGTIWVESEPGRGSRFYFTLKKLEHA